MAGESIRVEKVQGIATFVFRSHFFEAVLGSFVGSGEKVVYARSLPLGKTLPLSQSKLQNFYSWLKSAPSEQ